MPSIRISADTARALIPRQRIKSNSLPQNDQRRGAVQLRAVGFSPDSESFEHIRDQRPRKVAAQSLQGRRILLQKSWQVGGGLILLAKHVVFVLVKDLPSRPVRVTETTIVSRKLLDSCVDAL